ESENELSNDSEDVLAPGDQERRPNRFTGPAATWRRHTAAERRIAAALDQAESGDLAAHLYNAHALKRRARLPPAQLVEIKDWQGKDAWLRRGDDLQFTDEAGDVQTELVPFKRWTAWPLPPTNVPASNERFGRRGSNEAGDGWVIGGLGEQEPGDELREEVLALFLRLAKEKWEARQPEDGSDVQNDSRKTRSKFKTDEAAKDVDPDIEMGDADSIKEDSATQSEQEGNKNQVPDRRTLRHQEKSTAKPTFLADDDKARRILDPSINSLLAHLDNVAGALRCTRQNHYGRWGAHGYTSGSEMTSDTEPPTPGLEVHSWAKSGPSRRAQLQANSRARSTSRPTSKRQKTLPLDWSEVLGAAASRGWNEQALARTAQRCAALFGESMTFRSFDESLATKGIPDAVHYTPTAISPSNVLGNCNIAAPKRPFFGVGTLRCPHSDCWAHGKDYFPIPYRVIEHCQRVHGYDPRTNDSDNEERMVGGVHKDGFLEPINAQQGWLGQGRAKKKLQKV
ncbi:hypothetical protein P154DRAFT_406621, partial [Amniculicola lignicola CBS 123094]